VRFDNDNALLPCRAGIREAAANRNRLLEALILLSNQVAVVTR
jgi:hypothetical protein